MAKKRIVVMGLHPTIKSGTLAIPKESKVLESSMTMEGFMKCAEKVWERQIVTEIECEVCGQSSYVTMDHIIEHGKVCKDCSDHTYIMTNDGKVINLNKNNLAPLNIQEVTLDELEISTDNFAERFGQQYLNAVKPLITGEKQAISQYIDLVD